MFWLILLAVSILPTIYIVKREWTVPGHSFTHITLLLVTLISALLAFIQGITGTIEYPNLANQIEQIRALQDRVQDIREATYAYEKDGNFIAGSIENYKQSTNLSTFIKELAEKEAYYKGYLQECKTYKEVFPLYFFGPGWAISDRIYKLPER